MTRQEFCHTCQQKKDCRKVYEQLGRGQGPSITAKVILAFLLPLVVFILALAAFERILAGAIGESGLLTGISLLLALSAGFACIIITAVLRR